jgi:type I restriction enzyme M protein
MLDNITKKNIDDCRDVLVGKVPDPKSQIEQITIALIYKFMDDMDKEAVEKFKGKPKFFAPPKKTGDPKVDKKQIDYSKYGWRKLFDPKLGGKEMLELYSEALDKLQTNPNIPELFRNIFKNAYLPYRDPGTLKLFLKHIHSFEYSHSEKLGDAFEYLLSVMGSQGDAGQFRTPRHIIDFVTACVNPQKNETVLDPACGTAGFLLSAYKHILKQNSTPLSKKTSDHLPSPAGEGGRRPDEGEGRPGGALTPDQRKKLATNFVGYDISPDMVRLSLANMYLHGFATPQIHEYDSLSSEDRWNETFDVILANPPFMTPKGGIRPHKKFGVQANKAEVLFTDYIAEHLNSNGRAGIVVPNGIVATSQTAYKQLRKMLVTDCLIAVISLPAGVFQPYSGVKTSVLILDKRLAKKSQHILFLKIDNDGFDLGAQRREIDKNDLPLALKTLHDYKECLSNDKAVNELPSLATLVSKETVLANKDIGLSAERYFETKKVKSEFNYVKLGDVAKLIGGSTPSKDNNSYWENGNIDWITCSDFSESPMFIDNSIRKITEKAVKENSTSIIPEDTLVLVTRVSLGKMAFVTKPTALNQDLTALLFDGTKINKRYAYHCLLSIADQIVNAGHGATVKGVTRDFVKELEIPLPPLEIQQQIVAEIEGYQKIIDGAKQVVSNYKPTITIKPEWEMVELGEVCEIKSGGTPNRDTKEFWENGTIPWVKTGEINYGIIEDAEEKITELGMQNSSAKLIPKNTILMAMYGQGITRGRVAILGIDATINQACAAFIIRNKNSLNTKYLFYTLQNMYQQIRLRSDGHGGNQSNLSAAIIKEFLIPLPQIEEQQAIVKAIEEEMQLVSANKRIVEIFEQKIKTKISEVWGVKANAYQLEDEELSMAAEP